MTLLRTRALVLVGLVFGIVSCSQSTSRKTRCAGDRCQSPNALAGEKSPYLLQHANNPVRWYPWGKEAFAKARREDKPIFLSIGYSTCHWCHVMAHESFEDKEVARLMNEAFVCIKVDREERPDIDDVYMTVARVMTGRGGWPLTVIMTPDKRPFFVGTYLPKNSTGRRVGLVELTRRVSRRWKSKRHVLLQNASRALRLLSQVSGARRQGKLSKKVYKDAFELLARRYDSRYAGFGRRTKFPVPHRLLFLLRYWKRTGDAAALRMTLQTLVAMRRGGLYDHVGFGFHRYSTDRNWLRPHFEKMLYDQALLALVYLEAYQATRRPLFAQTAREIFAFVRRELTSPKGAFYSALDADSDGREGAFYVWTEAQLKKVLTPAEHRLARRVYNVQRLGNFTDEATGRRTGENILHRRFALASVAKTLKLTTPQLAKRLVSVQKKLLKARAARVRPSTDDKILTDWNGLMIAAFARGARVLDDPALARASRRAADFLLARLRKKDGRLLHRYRDGQAAIGAFLPDYAYLTFGLVELYQATFNERYLRAARDLTRVCVKQHWDHTRGGFYHRAHDGERLLVRRKRIADSARPSGNSVTALNLQHLSLLLGDMNLAKVARVQLSAFALRVNLVPAQHTFMLLAADFAGGTARKVVIAGRPSAADTKALLNVLRRRFLPNTLVMFRSTDTATPAITRLVRSTVAQTATDGKATAYVCLANHCLSPVSSAKELVKQLTGKSKPLGL